mgnify:CR=1 FL=1
MSNTNTEMSLSDEVIGQVARLVQIAILTGTDVVDNLRMLRVTFSEEDSNLVLTDEYRAMASEQLEKMLEEVSQASLDPKQLFVHPLEQVWMIILVQLDCKHCQQHISNFLKEKDYRTCIFPPFHKNLFQFYPFFLLRYLHLISLKALNHRKSHHFFLKSQYFDNFH